MYGPEFVNNSSTLRVSKISVIVVVASYNLIKIFLKLEQKYSPYIFKRQYSCFIELKNIMLLIMYRELS